MNFNRIPPLLTATLLLAGCDDQEPDAYGNFEAEEVMVSSEVPGQLVRLSAREGDRLAAGAVVGLVDTSGLALQIDELRARISAAGARSGQFAAEVAALEAQLRAAERELGRARRLFEARATTAQQLEQRRAEVEVLRERIRAGRQQTTGASGEVQAMTAQLAQLEDRLSRSSIVNPVAGTVLATHARAGEFVRQGEPVYEIADLDPIVLRAYLTGDQLTQVRLGQPVRVAVDGAEGELLAYPGVIRWIADEAEFTPTPIQTRNERADLVYAVRIHVPNPEGRLKIGMPAEVELAEDPAALAAAGR